MTTFTNFSNDELIKWLERETDNALNKLIRLRPLAPYSLSVLLKDLIWGHREIERRKLEWGYAVI